MISGYARIGDTERSYHDPRSRPSLMSGGFDGVHTNPDATLITTF